MPPANPNTGRPGPSGTEWAWVAAASVLVAAFASLPYFLAYGVRDHVFTGILINPIDGNSYLAKMAEGWRGDWLFTLPYTTDPGPGALIFTYYLFLGHLARWTGASLDLVYHAARAAGGLALSLMLFLTVSFHSAPYYTGADIVFAFAWTPLLLAGSGSVLSLDTAIARWADQRAGSRGGAGRQAWRSGTPGSGANRSGGLSPTPEARVAGPGLRL